MVTGAPATIVVVLAMNLQSAFGSEKSQKLLLPWVIAPQTQELRFNSTVSDSTQGRHALTLQFLIALRADTL